MRFARCSSGTHFARFHPPCSGYNPQGLGAAWSHNFLNQKPWHPANFRNQAKVFEAEQQAIKAQRDKAIAKVSQLIYQC